MVYEAKGKTGRVPRVGADRTSPIAPEWWDLPWFDAWVAGGCDHQLLGITVKGLERLLEDWTGDSDGGLNDEINFLATFQRGTHPGLEWVTDAFGREEDTGPIGYDLGHFVRIWDMVSGDMDKSVLEVILTRRKKYTTQEINYGYGPNKGNGPCKHRELKNLEWHWHTYGSTQSEMNPYGWKKEEIEVHSPMPFTSVGRMQYGHLTKQWKHVGEDAAAHFDWTQHVGPAHFFYSHVQLKPLHRTLAIIKGSLAKAAPSRKLLDLPEKEAPRVWLDYVNLRQCGNDFKPAAVIDLIKQIGVCFIEFDTNPTAYLGRTFCALEAFAAVKGGVPTAVLIDEVHALMVKDMLEANPVQVAKAQTRRRKDKDMIDAFIVESVGFEAVDAALTKFALDGAQATRERALTTMRVIRLRNLGLDTACVPAILELLKGAKTLQALDLRANQFDEASMHTLASTALASGVSLCGFMKRDRSDIAMLVDQDNREFRADSGPPEKERTDISGLDLIFAISDCRLILKEKPKLKNMRFCAEGVIDDVTAAWLVKLRKDEPRLVQIMASDNKITMAGAQMVADAVTADKDLAFMDISEGAWEEEGKVADMAAYEALKVVFDNQPGW